jgi:hypothetical protein
VIRALAAAIFAALVVAGGTGAGGRTTVLATLSRGVESDLVRVDPATLRNLGPRLALGRHGQPWTRSPDGVRLAVAGGRTVRIVDLRAWRIVRDVPLRGALVALAWPRGDRLVAVLAGRCCPQPLRVLAIDAGTGRVVARARLGRAPTLAAARTPDGLALLLGPPRGVGPARLAVVDASGRAHSARLDGIEAGAVTVRQRSPSAVPLTRYRTPGLAVDPAGRRALVAGDARLALVDLRTLTVRVAPLRVRTLADGGLSSGTYRRALWVRGDVVAVTGWTDRVRGKGAQRRVDSAPAGLLLVDARTLSARRVDSTTRTVTRAGRLLLATGEMGLTGYGLDGRRRYRALRGVPLGELPAAAGYAYYGAADSYKRHLVLILDLRSGRTSRDVWLRGALTPLTDANPRVCWC